jgi:site-specific DNA recombinase
MQKIAAYIRVSTDGQESDGHGLDVQRKHIIAYAATQGMQDFEWYEDVVSGAKEDRPQLNQLRADVKAGKVSAVLVYRLDRLARDTRIALNIEHEFKLAGAKVVSVSEFLGEGPMAEMMRTILFAFASFERAMIAARTKSGRQESVRKSGTFAGGSGVFGYRPVGVRGKPGAGVLAVDEREAEVIRRIFKMRAEGLSFESISNELNRLGDLPRAGVKFVPTHIKRVVDREEFYRGKRPITRCVETDKAAHEAILR